MVAKALAIATAIICALVNSYPARADTQSFPDFSGYTPANRQDYTLAVPNPGRQTVSEVYFLTPDGRITCDFLLAAAQCNYPATPQAVPNGVNWIATDLGLAQSSGSIASGNKAHGRPISRLPRLHSITVDGVICGVTDVGSTACKDPQGRGFWLRRNVLPPTDVPPTWSAYECSGSSCTSATLPQP